MVSFGRSYAATCSGLSRCRNRAEPLVACRLSPGSTEKRKLHGRIKDKEEPLFEMRDARCQWIERPARDPSEVSCSTALSI